MPVFGISRQTADSFGAGSALLDAYTIEWLGGFSRAAGIDPRADRHRRLSYQVPKPVLWQLEPVFRQVELLVRLVEPVPRVRRVPRLEVVVARPWLRLLVRREALGREPRAELVLRPLVELVLRPLVELVLRPPVRVFLPRVVVRRADLVDEVVRDVLVRRLRLFELGMIDFSIFLRDAIRSVEPITTD